MEPHQPPLLEERRIFSVGELVAGLRRLLEDRVGRVWIAGEIAGLRSPASGHHYFTLKDENAQVRAVLFRGDAWNLPFEPEEGLEVLAYGEVSVYPARGDLQVVVRRLEPRGRGALQLAVEQLRRRLEAEGLFDPAARRELPVHPRRIGIVTSTAGAAIRDVLQVSERRFPGTPLLVAGTAVQGDGAARGIARALERVGKQPAVDVVLLVRGGGSLEDLAAFNTEAVVRAIRTCAVPVVTGVGHEVDVTLADLAADARAPTPSAAVALVLPDRDPLRQRLDLQTDRLHGALASWLERLHAELAHLRETLIAHSPRARLALRRTRLEAARRALMRALGAELARGASGLRLLAGRLDSLSPLGVLARGYAIVLRAGEGTVVRAATDVAPGERLRIRLAEGEIGARADEKDT